MTSYSNNCTHAPAPSAPGCYHTAVFVTPARSPKRKMVFLAVCSCCCELRRYSVTKVKNRLLFSWHYSGAMANRAWMCVLLEQVTSQIIVWVLVHVKPKCIPRQTCAMVWLQGTLCEHPSWDVRLCDTLIEIPAILPVTKEASNIWSQYCHIVHAAHCEESIVGMVEWQTNVSK